MFSACEVDKPSNFTNTPEELLLKEALHDLVATGTTNKIEVINFSIDAPSIPNNNEKSFEPTQISIAYERVAAGPTDCCENEVLGFSECDVTKNFFIVNDEEGFELDYPEELNIWIIDRMNGNVVESSNTYEFDCYSATNTVFCDDNEAHGKALWWPPGTLTPGIFRVKVERWHVRIDGVYVFDCVSPEKFVSFGIPNC